jgi:hypothetical protein
MRRGWEGLTGCGVAQRLRYIEGLEALRIVFQRNDLIGDPKLRAGGQLRIRIRQAILLRNQIPQIAVAKEAGLVVLRLLRSPARLYQVYQRL